MSLETRKWLLLIHQIPPSPPYLRAKILKRLKDIGAVALKNSAYLLPDSEEALEDFQWLLNEIRSDRGEAWGFRVSTIDGLNDDSIRELFQAARAADYEEILAEVEKLAAAEDGGEVNISAALRKLRKRWADVKSIDFFGAPGKNEVLSAMEAIEKRLKGVARPGESAETPSDLKGRRWVTRRGIKIDRTACCWLIRRMIDPAAEFLFVDPHEYRHQAGDQRFDMFEGEYTHEGDRCSFEVLIDRFQLENAGLRMIAEIVHDLDLKDGKFGRPEAAGVGAMIDGLAFRHNDDTKRMEEGLVIFDALYARLRPIS
ncbi:MAG: ChrB protein [Terriglobia bacterium]|nr:MAG: ChrB protein [Terriglobia bacterium]